MCKCLRAHRHIKLCKGRYAPMHLRLNACTHTCTLTLQHLCLNASMHSHIQNHVCKHGHPQQMISKELWIEIKLFIFSSTYFCPNMPFSSLSFSGPVINYTVSPGVCSDHSAVFTFLPRQACMVVIYILNTPT